jgi:hypothetical protein
MNRIQFTQSTKNVLVALMTSIMLLGIFIITAFFFSSIKIKKPNELKATSVLYNLGYGHIVAKAIHTASYYKLFDELAKCPKTAQEMAVNKNLNAKNVKILLRVLANHHVIEMDKNQKFSLTPVSNLLVSHIAHSLQPIFAKEFDQRRWVSLAHVDWAMKEDIVPFEKLYGESFYEYLERDPQASQLFNEGMSVFSQNEDKEIAVSYPFNNFKVVCDVGGGKGSLISKVLTNYQEIKGLLFDLNSVIDKAEALQDQQFSGRLDGMAGNFFDKVPQADAFLVKRVIHNWGDEQSVKILQNCVDALTDQSTGKIFVIDKVMPGTIDGSMLIDAALMGLGLGAGTERSLEEFIALGERAHIKLEEKIDTKAGLSILVFIPEAYK